MEPPTVSGTKLARVPELDFTHSLSEKLSIDTALSPTQPTQLDTETHSTSLHNPDAQSRSPADDLAVYEAGRSQHFTLRTLPAWIRSVEEVADDDTAAATDRLLPSQPRDVQVAQHNHSPYGVESRDFAPALGSQSQEASPARESRWATFARFIQYPKGTAEKSKEVTPDWLNENYGDLSSPWRGRLLDGDSPEHPLHTKSRRRQMWLKRFHTTLLRSPMVPLILRLTVWCFSLSALALGGSLQHMADKGHTNQGPSALMAVIVDAVALIYLVYITVDEYTSKPLGLRSPSAKARLILLDLFFIVFDSANLSLAFNSLSEVTGACTEAEVNRVVDPRNDQICIRQKALASVLLIALLAWLLTFCLSVLR
ncbi:Uncharacterized protein PECH_001823 [Penicillium ucsense]|uniref:Regulator of phospholipase D SRF1 n=1 Tax=Penicillium ucsense TaxID=2839758 RepID=A0A8J8VX71_9EURO|nr:Uncharacterized protein PECM_001579 [Penicillium ucsense]KAF7732245.1 Uncharacterized protein PECH_001823 [Penicillium ucsense]